VCAAYDVLPSDPNLLALNEEQLYWLQHAKRSYLKELFENLGIMLGTNMTSDMLYGSGKKSKSKLVDSASVPLSFLIGENAQKIFKSVLTKTAGSNDMINISGSKFRDLMKSASQQMHQEASQALDEIRNLT
jgi:hypothetical protein